MTSTLRIQPSEAPSDGALPATAPAISVVIPTHRRDDGLRRALEGVLSQDFGAGFEVVVVDDARSPSTPLVVAAAAATHPGSRLTLLQGAGRGPAAARNLGWRATRGDVIAFLDDDAYPANDRWLRAGYEAFADPRVDGVSGAVRVPVNDPPTDFQRNVQHLETAPFVTCNAFYRRSALERVGGFDEAFTVPFREDSDLQFRVEALGGALVRCEEAVVVHPAPRGRFGISLRLQRYSMFNALMYKKHPRRYRELQRRPPLEYYAIVGLMLGAAGACVARRPRLAVLLLGGWAGLEGRFCARRIRGVSHEPAHVLDMALTSVAIPPLSVYWRLRGAVRFRVPFV